MLFLRKNNMKKSEQKNFYRITLKPKGGFIKKSFRTLALPYHKGIKLIIAKRPGETTTKTQAAIFDKKIFTPGNAAAWVKEHITLLKNPCSKIANPKKKKHKAGRKKNPAPARQLSELYRTFHGADAKGRGELFLDIERGLIRLGNCDGVYYLSKKQGGKEKAYIHKFNWPFPDLYCNLAGNTLIIHGNFKIKKEGITG